MNIFAVSCCPFESAMVLPDKLVVKMPLETAQILSTVVRLHCEEPNVDLYKPTHINHPCTLWAAHSQMNFRWLCAHGLALCGEYIMRFNKCHASTKVIIAAGDCTGDIPQRSSLTHVACMPDEFKSDDVYASYRRYVKSKPYFENGFRKGRDFTSFYKD